MSLFRKPETFRIIVDLFADRIMQLGAIDAVVGLESRGFIIGAPVCYKLGIPFVVVRKKGKLPGKKLNVTYELEYGQVLQLSSHLS
jgi:adenine phosphoribosyltransferase